MIESEAFPQSENVYNLLVIISVIYRCALEYLVLVSTFLKQIIEFTLFCATKILSV